MAISIERVSRQLASQPSSGAAVLIPLLQGTSGLEVLLEVRASTLDVQPGEVCLPGGHLEEGETPLQAAMRETCEELCVDPTSVRVLGSLGTMSGPGGMPLWVFVGELDHYEGTFSADEVDHTFALSLDWLVAHEPRVFELSQKVSFPPDFPWDLIPGGRSYAWRTRTHEVPFYLGTDPLVWGVTARILSRFARLLQEEVQP